MKKENLKALGIYCDDELTHEDESEEQESDILHMGDPGIDFNSIESLAEVSQSWFDRGGDPNDPEIRKINEILKNGGPTETLKDFVKHLRNQQLDLAPVFKEIFADE